MAHTRSTDRRSLIRLAAVLRFSPDRERHRRLEQLKKQHGWGDLSDADYQAQRDAVRTALAALPDDDRIRSFDAYRTRLLALPEAITVALPDRRLAGGRAQPAPGDDRLDARGDAGLRKTAGVPPRGLGDPPAV
jgi:hypothetical protein